MRVVDALEIVFWHTWWRYDPSGPDQWFAQPYHWFNIAEGCVWLWCGCVVLRRYARNARSRKEIAYGVLFLTFGCTDFVEAWWTSSWLIWLKLMNLIALLWIRRIVMSTYYPDARLF